ncbi:hypothetical protein OG204_25795 [Streptomyces sp. NBC_01387]
MTGDTDTEAPLPSLTVPPDCAHPVLAAVLAEIAGRDPREPLIAYYEDAP